MASGELGRQNIHRAIAGFAAALAIFDDRNRCSHVYRESMVPEILARLPGHLAVMQQVTARCDV